MTSLSLVLTANAVAGSNITTTTSWPIGVVSGSPGIQDIYPVPGITPTPTPTTTTITTLYPGSVTSTTTIPATGSGTGTVIVEWPSYVTTTIAYTGPANLNGTTTVTVSPSGTVQGTVYVETATASPLPTLNCDPAGYLIQGAALYQVNISTGALTLVKSTVGNGTNINAMGYNVADNLLYAANGNNLIRIAANGDAAYISPLNISSNASLGLNAGDVDENSQYWATNSGAYWLQVDLKPGSSTFGTVVANGTATSPYRVIDWAFVPGGGNYLYGLGYNASSINATYLQRFDRTAHTWTVLSSYGNLGGSTNISGNAFGAAYASDDGYLFGQENTSGGIYKFTLNSTNSTLLATGNKTSSNDGARCINSTNISGASRIGLAIREYNKYGDLPHLKG